MAKFEWPKSRPQPAYLSVLFRSWLYSQYIEGRSFKVAGMLKRRTLIMKLNYVKIQISNSLREPYSVMFTPYRPRSIIIRSMLRSDSAGLQRLSQNCAAGHNKLVEF